MNDFLEQFLIESRELATQLADDLAALEQAGQDRERLDRVFRAFHTLKGAAGIVDFHAMGQLMHLVEDALAEARSTGQPVSAVLIGNCIGCLDLLGQWLTDIEATEALPPHAEMQIGRLRDAFGGERVDVDPPAAGLAMNASSWLDALMASMPAPSEARTVLRYAPDPASFFQGRDPLGLIADLPGLCSLSIQPRQAWPEIDVLDPFDCNVIIYAYSTATMAQITGYKALPAAEVEINDLTSPKSPQAAPSAEAASRILQAQVRLLAAVGPKEALAGRLNSAARVAGNVLRYVRCDDSARIVGEAADQSAAAGQADDLIAALQAAIELLDAPDHIAAETDTVNRQPHVETTNALRVDVRRIDAIVKLTGELTVVKNAVGHVGDLLAAGSSRESVSKALQEQQSNLERLINELQRSVLAIRVLPLRTVFRRFPRLVKEIAATVGKEIDLVTAGDDTEADKLVVESLFEPLLHVLRNAVDHGIETREQRLPAGKPQTALLRLGGYRDGDDVIIDVADDGRGIDPDAIAKVALNRRLITQEALATMTREEILDIVFLPGFSTAEKVTGLSGRGVGMDAVRSAVEQFGGRVSIQTEVGVGTTIRFTLPFSVMMTRVMTIEAGGQMFGLPFEAMIEMLHIPRKDILPVGATQAIVFRGQTIPFVSLPMTLGGGKADISADPAKVVIAHLGGHLGALEVERFGERMDLMLTPRTGLLSGVMGIAGTTLLGDGRVLIVLELQELLQ